MTKKWKKIAASSVIQKILDENERQYNRQNASRALLKISMFLWQDAVVWENGPHCVRERLCEYKLSSYGTSTNGMCLNCWDDHQRDMRECEIDYHQDFGNASMTSMSLME